MKFAEALKMGATALDALELIQKITGKGGPNAPAALTAANAAIGALLQGLDGKQTPQEVLSRIEALHADLALNDAAADKALHDKFDQGAG